MGNESDEQEDFVRTSYDIPSANDLESMSYPELMEVLFTCEKQSAKFHVVEREIKKRLLTDQAKINRSNIIIGASIAGAFTVIGAVLGAYLSGACL